MATPRIHLTSLLLPFALLSACSGAEEQAPVESAIVLDVADPNFQSPRAAIHDPVADVYLVSNVNGGETEADENGFISIVVPDGGVQNPAWIRTTPQVLLHAPKGLAILGDTLLVADLDCIRFYSRINGESLGGRCLEGVTSLSGLAVNSDGSIFITESGVASDGSSTGSAAVYRISLVEGQAGSTLGVGGALGTPRSVTVGSRGIIVASTNPGQIIHFTGTGEQNVLHDPPNEAFQGVVFVGNGGFAYSSSSTSSIHLVDASGQPSTLAEGIGTPGDLGYDAVRNRLLVPIADQNRLLVLQLD
jgi:hypothetical protein